MHLTIRGLVLRVTNYNDTDALLTILTHCQGKLTIKARGLRRKNSPLAAICQLLVYNEFTLFEYRGMYTINEAHPVEMFQSLRSNLQKLSLATYFAQVAELLSQEDLPNPEMLTLTLNSIYALAYHNIANEQVKAVFELRCACLSGYTPDLHGCWKCNRFTSDLFNISEGRLECVECQGLESNGIRMPVNAGALEAMRYICSCDAKHLFAFRVGEDTMLYLSAISESYLVTQLERGFSALDFYKTLLIDI